MSLSPLDAARAGYLCHLQRQYGALEDQLAQLHVLFAILLDERTPVASVLLDQACTAYLAQLRAVADIDEQVRDLARVFAQLVAAELVRVQATSRRLARGSNRVAGGRARLAVLNAPSAGVVQRRRGSPAVLAEGHRRRRAAPGFSGTAVHRSRRLPSARLRALAVQHAASVRRHRRARRPRRLDAILKGAAHVRGKRTSHGERVGAQSRNPDAVRSRARRVRPGPVRLAEEDRIMEYRVRWEIDVDADSAREAALKAREAQTDPATLATVFSAGKRLISRRARERAGDAAPPHRACVASDDTGKLEEGGAMIRFCALSKPEVGNAAVAAIPQA